MYVIVVGAGEVGDYLATILVQEGHEVAVIEIDDSRAADLDARLDALVIAGSGLTYDAMNRAGVANADLLMAVTAGDEVNLISCMVAARANPHLRTVARVHAEQYRAAETSATLSARDLGIGLLMSPEQAVANDVLEQLLYVGPGEMWHLANHRLVMLGIHLVEPDSLLVSAPLAQLQAGVLPPQSVVVAVEGKSGFRIPAAADRLEIDERAYVLTVPEHVGTFLTLSGAPRGPLENVLIVGCGQIGFALAAELEARKVHAVILDEDESRADWVAGKLSGALVIHADGTNLELVRERIKEDHIESAVILVDDDEKSLLIGLFAKSLGAKRVICRCDNLAYGPLANHLGVDAIVTPKKAVANAILRYARRGQVESTLVLGDHDIEIIDFRVPDRPAHKELLTRPLAELSLPAAALIGAVVRNDEVFMPRGDTILEPGDRLLVATLPQAVPEVDQLLAGTEP